MKKLIRFVYMIVGAILCIAAIAILYVVMQRSAVGGAPICFGLGFVGIMLFAKGYVDD